jgi:hypothetical protein
MHPHYGEYGDTVASPNQNNSSLHNPLSNLETRYLIMGRSHDPTYIRIPFGMHTLTDAYLKHVSAVTPFTP